MVHSLEEVQVSMLVKGYVENSSHQGIFVQLGHNLKALVKVRDHYSL